MVPVKKPIIAGKSPEAAEPQKRRPRNTELNSSMKNAVPKVRRSLNSSMASNIDRLVGSVKASEATDYDDKMEVLNQSGAYEEELMADAYYKAEQELSKMYGMPNIMLETSVRNGRGRVDALTDGGEPGCATLSSYDFQKETEAVWDTIKSWSGNTAGLVDAVAQKIVDLVDANADTGKGELNSSEDDSQPLNNRQAVINQLVDESPYSPEDAEELVTSFEEETGANIERLATIEEAEQYDGMFWATKDGKTALWCRGNGFWYEKDDLNSSEESDSVNPSEKDVQPLNSKDMNCSEGESGTIYTESGNEVAITDIKVVQNPETNALALFVPENGDDEIPEGFTVIGDVIATAAGAPAIEENAETGDGSLNSSKKPPMNRAQRRAAQRGARRPKKR